MKWFSRYVEDEVRSIPVQEELDELEEQLEWAHTLITYIAKKTWDDDHRRLCWMFLRRYPEPPEEDDECKSGS